jgi:hypothetical protein
VEEGLGEYQFGFKRGKGTSGAIGMLRVISKRAFDKDEELCGCFIDWQKACESVKWTKLLQILKGTGMDWRDRRLISKFYMDQSVKMKLDYGETRGVKTGRGDTQGCCLSPILFNFYGKCRTKEAF